MHMPNPDSPESVDQPCSRRRNLNMLRHTLYIVSLSGLVK